MEVEGCNLFYSTCSGEGLEISHSINILCSMGIKILFAMTHVYLRTKNPI